MTEHKDLFAALAAPFEQNEVKVRDHAGRQLHYVTARTIMNRLDNVLGPENWWDEFVPNENSVLCRLTIRLPDGAILTKSDAGGYAGMADSGDDDKSGYSDAFKRAAVKFGISRYLYRDGVPTFVTQSNGHPKPVVAPDRTASPSTNGHANRNGNGRPGTSPDQDDRPPTTGRSLFAWSKGQEQRHQLELVKYLNNWGRLQEFPSRMVDWSRDQVTLAYHEAVRKIHSLNGGVAEGAIP